MKTKLILLLLLVSTLMSCNSLPSREKDPWWYECMTMIFTSYTRTYFKMPESVDEITRYLDLTLEEGNGFLGQGDMFNNQYNFLKKNRERIIFVNDGEYMTMFYQKALPKNEMAFIPVDKLCGDEKGLYGQMYIFDNDGDIVLNQSFDGEYSKTLYRTLALTIGYRQRNMEWEKNPRGPFPPEKVIFLEYIPQKGLMDICTHESIDIRQSEYFSKMSDILRDFCEEHSLSRIILDSYVPVE